MSFELLIGFVVVSIVAWWWFIGRNKPKYPPLEIDDDDPLMLEAIQQANSTIPSFLELLSKKHSEAQVKVPFTSSSGVVEHLWAEVLGAEGSVLELRYYTPPVTHEGKLDRVHKHNISEIEDWVVILEDGKIHGGFTQRVMFERGKEQWGELPPELAEQESRYVA